MHSLTYLLLLNQTLIWQCHVHTETPVSSPLYILSIIYDFFFFTSWLYNTHKTKKRWTLTYGKHSIPLKKKKKKKSIHEVHELGCTKYRGTLLNKCCHLVNYGFWRPSVPQKYHLSSLCYESLYESRRIFFFQMVAISFCQHKGKDEEGLFPSQCGGERTHERET